jgi:hypothetical protein
MLHRIEEEEPMPNDDLWSNISFPVTVEPYLTGKLGKAWLCNLAAGYVIMKIKPEQDACICHWVIEASWAHPAWHSYSIFCQHLRPIPGYDHPVIHHLKDATHEMLVFALDPRKDRDSMIKTGIVEGRWLQPANFAAQFIAINDDVARKKIGLAIMEIVDGKLSPDTDYRAMWIERFGGNMVKE